MLTQKQSKNSERRSKHCTQQATCNFYLHSVNSSTKMPVKTILVIKISIQERFPQHDLASNLRTLTTNL